MKWKHTHKKSKLVCTSDVNSLWKFPNTCLSFSRFIMDVFANAPWSGDHTLSSTEVQTSSLSTGLFWPITGAASALSSSPISPNVPATTDHLRSFLKCRFWFHRSGVGPESLDSNRFSGGDDSVGPQISSKEPGIRPWALGTCEPPGSISSNTS